MTQESSEKHAVFLASPGGLRRFSRREIVEPEFRHAVKGPFLLVSDKRDNVPAQSWELRGQRAADASRESTRRVRVFDSHAAVTYTAAGSAYAWRAYSHDQDSAKPRAPAAAGGVRLLLPAGLDQGHESHFALALNAFLDHLDGGVWPEALRARLRMRYTLLARAGDLALRAGAAVQGPTHGPQHLAM